MKVMTVKVIGKDIKSDNGDFTAYSLLTSKGNWYKTAKAKPEQLAEVQGEVVNVTVSRRFDKVITVKGEERTFPTLVIEDITEPTLDELMAYEEELQALNDKTLEDVI